MRFVFRQWDRIWPEAHSLLEGRFEHRLAYPRVGQRLSNGGHRAATVKIAALAPPVARHDSRGEVCR